MFRYWLRLIALSLSLVFAFWTPAGETTQVMGYYRYPAVHGDTIVFTAEGDLWSVPTAGGPASRLTTHPDRETRSHISPDGLTVAFTGHYEGPSEVYTMPLEGGLPIRQTYEGRRAYVQGWTPDSRVLYETSNHSTLPDYQLATLNPYHFPDTKILPLSQAAEGTFAANGVLVFTRLHFQGSQTKRYVGGSAQNLWSFDSKSGNEAQCLTCDYRGTSKSPRFMDGRVYFLTDRDGTMNLWSMTSTGDDLQQHTRHSGWDIVHMDAQGGQVVYALGADLWLWKPGMEKGRQLTITLPSDNDQRREKWVDKPLDYLSSSHLSADGEKVVLTARGEVFTLPVKGGRLAHITRAPGVRYRNARFMPDGETLLSMSDESGEVEFWQLPVNGAGEAKQLTSDATTLRFDGIPSPDEKWIGSHDKNGQVWVHNMETGEGQKILAAKYFYASELTWSPDSRYLAMTTMARNVLAKINLFNVESGQLTQVTSDRVSSYSPAFSPDGKFLWFLSDRDLKSSTPSPWGPYQPDPFLDKAARIYGVSLSGQDHSPFLAATELDKESSEEEKEDDPVKVVLNDKAIYDRIFVVPAPRGNYEGLVATADALFVGRENDLMGIALDAEDHDLETVASGVGHFELSGNGKFLLITKGGSPYVFAAKAKEASLKDAKVDLSGWSFSLDPREEWRQMFIEAWRLERDYFYDPGMHGTDWQGILDKHLPLVDRITDRAELQDLIGQMVGELSALHTFVYGGDFREGPDQISQGTLAASWQRDAEAKGYRITHVFGGDPDFPELRSPLAAAKVNVQEGDIILSINGVSLLDVNHPGSLLRNQVGNQVLLSVQNKDQGKKRQVIVTPVSSRESRLLRYAEWKYSRRTRVDKMSNKDIGYVHLSAMSGSNYSEFARDFYPAFDRKGLILDVRHNGGGNIDSWILSKLIREIWMFWQARTGEPYWNMPFAFPGHMVVLCNEKTGSDGEAFAEGFRRLGLGPVIGTRSWGGEIWLTSSNRLVDGGIATAAEFGVYGPEGQWIIEGEGVIPDTTVDNLPVETFKGKDRQLEAAVAYLKKKMEEEPVNIPQAPAYPDKSFDYPKGD